MPRRARSWVVLLAVAVLGASAACSLGLDESLIDREVDAGLDAEVAADVDVPDVPDAGLPDVTPEAGTCTKDEDCKTLHGCLTARCDVPRKACVYDVCRKAACSSSACDQGTQTCAAPEPYKYLAAQFPIESGVACGTYTYSRCFAAVYPYIFVVTPTGVIAFSAADPASTKPRRVPLTGLGFVPVEVQASGNRVYFLGPHTGLGAATPQSHVSVAWADVPADPFSVSIPVHSALPSLDRPSNEGLTLYSREGDTTLLLDTVVATSYASSVLAAPVAEPLALTMTPLPFTADTIPVAVSGSRLLMYDPANDGTPTFGFISGAGGVAPKNEGQKPLADAEPVYPSTAAQYLYFGTTPGGAVLWNAPVLTGAYGGMPAPFSRAAKAYFLVADGAAQPSAAAGIDVEVYPSELGASARVVGPVAMLDANTAIVTAGAKENYSLQSSVQFVTKSPPSLVKDGEGAPRRAIIARPPSALGVAASHGLGYVLSVESATAATVYVFDPGCDP